MQVSDGWQGLKREDCPRYVAAMLNRKGSKGFLAYQAGVEGEPQETRDAAVAIFLGSLCQFVDQWIDSGKSEQDEKPWERSIHWSSPAHPTPIVKALSLYGDWCPPRLLIGPKGQFEIGMLPVSTVAKSPIPTACMRAAWWVIMLLDSPNPERLSRCDACHAYYVRARAPKKETPIYRGVFCPNCKGKGGLRRMNVARDNRVKKLVRLAAGFWPQWKPLPSYGKQSEWVAAKVNKVLGAHERISDNGNWVTRHRSEIEAEAERRK
jgi:hypothetical protein